MNEIRNIFRNHCDEDGWYSVQLGKNVNKVLPNNTMFELDSITKAIYKLTNCEIIGNVIDDEGNCLLENAFCIKDIIIIPLESTEINTGMPIYGIFGKVKPLDLEVNNPIIKSLNSDPVKVSFRLDGICSIKNVEGVIVKYVHKIKAWNYIDMSRW